MLYGLEDVTKLRQLLESSDAPDVQKQIERRKLEALVGYCETTRCRRQVLLAYFGETLDGACGNCDACLEPAESIDGTELVQKALSAVYRTGQRFGAAHVIDVLRGGDTEKVRKFGHERLTTYGIGQELSASEWRSVFRQLVAIGLLVVDAGHGGLRLGPECRDVLRGERRVELLREEPRRRKTATARVWVFAGAGSFSVNKQEPLKYFKRASCETMVRSPMQVAGMTGKVDIVCTVRGGGLSGQAGAVRHGIARALTAYDASLRGQLKKAGLLTRDPRAVERKKPGRAGARRRFQFSKR
jgi:superfamily II DNA helicase RecQ